MMGRDIDADRPEPGDADPLADELELIAQRDLAALTRLYNATYGRLYAICFRITQNRESAEDVLQEVYIKIWNRAAGYDRRLSRSLAWLGRLARNSAIDWYRAQARQPMGGDVYEGQLIDDGKSIDEELIDREQEERALGLMDGLRDDQRNSLRDVFFGGLTYAELARRDGVPLGTVKSRIHRAIMHLAQRWQHD